MCSVATLAKISALQHERHFNLINLNLRLLQQIVIYPKDNQEEIQYEKCICTDKSNR